jgi:MtfA peptidase
MVAWWRERRRRRLLNRYAIDADLWRAVLADSPLFDRLSADERARLYELTVLFLVEKRFFGAHELTVDDYMRASVAARACLLVFALEPALDYYSGWRTVILYPSGFVAEREFEDEIGVVHTGEEALDGESMYGGSVVLNWEEARPVRDGDAVDVVLHEFAHKLDERTGEANGLPPLHDDMSVSEWSAVFCAAYDTLNLQLDEGEDVPLDEYAATDPAEFFSVVTEAFFLQPQDLRDELPEVYAQLALFYRQDPAVTPRVRG